MTSSYFELFDIIINLSGRYFMKKIIIGILLVLGVLGILIVPGVIKDYNKRAAEVEGTHK